MVSSPGPVHSCHFIGRVCVQGVCMRVARVGGRCAVVWLASEWHRVVRAVCVLHMVLKMGVFPSCLSPLPVSAHMIAWCTAE